VHNAGADANPNANHDPHTNPDHTYPHLKLDVNHRPNPNSTRSMTAHCASRISTRCSAIAEKPRCRVRYSFRQK